MEGGTRLIVSRGRDLADESNLIFKPRRFLRTDLRT